MVQMIVVEVKGDLERALGILKRKIVRDGVLASIRWRADGHKKSVAKRDKQRRAARRRIKMDERRRHYERGQ